MQITIKTLTAVSVKVALFTFLIVPVSMAAGSGFGPLPISLKDAPVPEVPGLLDGPDPIIVNPEKAIALGKALFWDMNVGSDGVACATCHFHAGADRRIKNQIAPIGRNSDLPAFFSQLKDGSSGGPNTVLTKDDFPFFDTDDPKNHLATVIYDSDDVVSSAGTFGGFFHDVGTPGTLVDNCDRAVGAVFHVGAKGTRRVEPRNTPTVINAVFNFRNFWDGRANNIFNGSSEWGDRDPDAGVWIRNSNGTVSKQRLRLVNSALASQALATVVNSVEMACENRTLADLGRKLLFRFPLEHQQVHWNDSVLGNYAYSTEGQLQKGLKVPYYILIMQAFNSKYWSHFVRGQYGAPPPSSATHNLPYLQAEANFGMFFALALQMYQSTLISDDSPFDRSARDTQGIPIDLSESAQRGQEVFRRSHCALCHIGPNFTSSAVVTNRLLQQSIPEAFGNAIFRISVNGIVTQISGNAGAMLEDIGFSATGVTPDENDPGLGGFDPFGNPLSFAEQYMQLLAGNTAAVVDSYVENIRACDLDSPIARGDLTNPHLLIFTQADGVQLQQQDTVDCFDPLGIYIPTVEAAQAELEKPDRRRFLSAAKGSFKVPSLRNIELTGPYMHNGGMSTLEQTIEFYTRDGNFDVDAKEFSKIFSQGALRFDPQQFDDMLNFLKSLTDERVRYKKAPFDHPELFVPHGHAGDNSVIVEENTLNSALAADEILVIPAVGAEGSAEPIKPFVDYLD